MIPLDDNLDAALARVGTDGVDVVLDLAARGVIEVDIQRRTLADAASTWGDRGRLVYLP